MPTCRFVPHVIDRDLPGQWFGQTDLADLDGDGRLEYLVAMRGGPVYAYRYRAPDDWWRHQIGDDSPSDVGGKALDVDGDGRIDFVAGGAWYRNSGSLDQPFERIVFDPDLHGVHDVAVGDIDGDGRLEIVTMADALDIRWYRIGDDPAAPWTSTTIGPPVHAGLALGDLDGDGDLDVVRTDVWFENAAGDGTRWVEHPIGPNTPPPADFQPSFAYNATRAWVVDLNGDGRNDIVFTDAEIPGGKVWWMESLDGRGGAWRRHEVCGGGSPRRGAYHSLWVGDIDGDGDHDILSCEMEWVRGEGTPRWYVWENRDGRGREWHEQVICDINLGGHEAVVGDITGNGYPDVLAKPWEPHPDNANGGRGYVVFLENQGPG